MKYYLLFGLLLLSFTQVKSQIAYQIGDSVASFSLTSTDGSTWALEAQTKGLILVFINNDCPIVELYIERLKSLQKRFGPQGFAVVAINSNFPQASPNDSFPQMQQFAAEQQLNFSYLSDADQTVARAFGASRTPQCFVLARDARETLRLQYIGAIDDNARQADAVNVQYLEDALRQLIAQEAVKSTYTRAVGCGIKWAQ
ncbi:MAG: thioredoxin family protein [Bacteroidia bacterium]